MTDRLQKLFDDQMTFNKLLWTKDDSEERFMDRLRVLSLGMVEETLEMLRTYEWKPHRRVAGRLPNVANTHEQLADMFKYWLSLADLTGFPMDKLEEIYHAKSRVVRYRFQEEWMSSIDGPCVLVDIDNVLADYITGICHWTRESAMWLMNGERRDEFVRRLDEVCRARRWVSAESLGIPLQDWTLIKHDFRIRGGKRTLPVFPDAKPFLKWCRSMDYQIVLVTSRPIDRYPNLFTDTMTWLHDNDLPFDYLWWASDKSERLEDARELLQRAEIKFAVDDSPKFVAQFLSKGIKTYLLDRTTEPYERMHDAVYSLFELMEKENVNVI